MTYRLTPHAVARLGERGIPGEWLEQVLQLPQCVVPAAYGRKERKGLFERDGVVHDYDASVACLASKS